MNGLIIHDTPIAVDYWMIRHASTAKLFFLSHAHADHTAGLSPSWNEPIYCSEVTGRIIRHKFKIKQELIRTLEVGQSHIMPIDDMGKETMTVTMIDANHCPGAVMFLFEGYFGTILYTGDFRFHKRMLTDTILSQTKNVDVLYLDNTYCDPQCCFPCREEAIEQTIDLIRQHPDHNVVLGATDIGKEELFVAIAERFKIMINVSNEKYETLKVLGVPNVFTTDPEADSLRVMSRKELKIPLMKSLTSDPESPTIILIPTCLFSGAVRSPYEDLEDVYVIPFSDHSSFQELCEFVSSVSPKEIVPIVDYKKKVFGTDCSNRSNMKCFEKYLDCTPREKFAIPKSVQFLMSSANSFNLKRPTLLKRGRSESTGASARRTSKRHCRGVIFDTPPKSQNKVAGDVGDESDAEGVPLSNLGQTLVPDTDVIEEVHNDDMENGGLKRGKKKGKGTMRKGESGRKEAGRASELGDEELAAEKLVDSATRKSRLRSRVSKVGDSSADSSREEQINCRAKDSGTGKRKDGLNTAGAGNFEKEHEYGSAKVKMKQKSEDSKDEKVNRQGKESNSPARKSNLQHLPKQRFQNVQKILDDESALENDSSESSQLFVDLDPSSSGMSGAENQNPPLRTQASQSVCESDLIGGASRNGLDSIRSRPKLTREKILRIFELCATGDESSDSDDDEVYEGLDPGRKNIIQTLRTIPKTYM